MSCTGLVLEEQCLDISGGTYVFEGTSEDTDFVNEAKAELYIRSNLIATYTVGDGITISDYNGNPRYIEIDIEDIPTGYVGHYMYLYVRPSADVTDLITERIRVVNNNSKR